MSQLDYFPVADASTLRAIAWLERGTPYATGATPQDVYARLVELCKEPFEPFTACGYYECTLCQFDGAAGIKNLFIPGNGFLYVCPELIIHYINAHHYQPPADFAEAVLCCPAMG